MTHLRLRIEGMSCGHCVRAVRQTLESFPGVVVGEVALGSAELDLDPSLLSLERILEALSAAGYPARSDLST